MANEIFPNSSRSPAGVIGLGQPVTLTWAATATLGIAYREGAITKPNGQVVNLARVWYPDGPLGPQSFTDTVLAGLYSWRSRYADMSVLQGAANGLTGQYYNGTDLNPAELVFTRTDPNINYSFPSNSPPAPGIVSDHYSMRWTGTIIPRFTGNYTFSTLSDDGVRLYVNNANLINNWTDHGATTDVGPPIFLQANVAVPIVVEFFNNFGPGLLTLYWQSAAQNYEVVPQSQLRNTGSTPPTYGTGYIDQVLTFQVGGLTQASVAIAPTTPTVQIGATVNFTASGGTGTGLFNWGGEASGVGTTKSVQFNSVGTFQVTVYRAGDNTYNQSNTATSTITVVKANQATLVASPANTTVAVGTIVTLTANGGTGTGQYQWGGAVSLTTSLNSIQFQVPAAGLSQITCVKLGDATLNNSNQITFNVTGVKSSQAAVTVSPTPINVEPGTTVMFTAAGGSGTGQYQWGGDASGTGSTKQVTFNTAGSRTVTVVRLADAAYNQSNTATAAVTVQVHVITPNSSRTPATRPVGSPFTLTWAATATLGIAYREGSILQADSSVVSLARVNSFEPGMLGPQSFLPTGGKGVYTWTSKYADQSINTGPPFTGGTGFVEQQLTFTVTGLSQSTVVISPSTVGATLGDEITFTASGGSGTGDYQWGSDASGTGSSKAVTFNTPGVRTVTVKKLGDSTYADSNLAIATITVTKLVQAVVTISPSSIDVEPGTLVTFTASGGSGTGDYQWSGDASGTGTTKDVTFNVGGSRVVNVKRLGDSTYQDSNFAQASIDVAVHIITPNSSRTPSPASFGQPVTLKWNATATLDIYFREGSIVKPDGNTVALNRVYYNEAGMLGFQSFTDTAQRGTYTWTSRYADFSIINPPLTYGVGFKDQILTFFVNGINQAALSLTPGTINTFVGNTAVFTASGGSGTGLYHWRLFYHQTSSTVTIDTTDPELILTNVALGTVDVWVTKVTDLTYNSSNEAGPSHLVVVKATQTTVTIAPTAVTVEIGSSVTFNAVGGSGTGQYLWGGKASGNGSSKVVHFAQLGTFQVTVLKLGDTLFNNSNTATATVIVTAILPPTVTIFAFPAEGSAPFSTTITWSSENAVGVTVSGPGLSSTAQNGSELVSGLGTGVKIYTIHATNAGGTTSASVQVTIDLTPVETTGFTVHFTDQTVLRADTWLWDFGDGSSTSTVRNPIHTYNDLGVFLVTLTVTCDGQTDVKQKLISIGCNPSDPFPFTPDWNTLVNEEDYDPFNDPRYVGTDYTSPLGPSASRQSGPANPNWTMCPDVDYCDGPNDLDVVQLDRFSRRWKVRLVSGKVTFGQVDVALIDAPEDMFPPSLSMANTTYITLSFDSRSAPYFAYQVGTNQIRVHFRLNGVPLKVQFTGEAPRLFSEVIINPIAELCDVVLFYVRAGKMYVRFQRENFAIERFVCEPTIYGEELAVFTKIDANRDEQRIYLYGKTLGGKRLLFRSGLYPGFPDPNPIHVDVDPEFGKNAITLASGSYERIDTVEFTDMDITLSSIDHSRQQEDGAHFVTILDGTTAPVAEKGSTSTSILDGSTDRISEAGVVATVIVDGTTANNTAHILNDVTIAGGTYGNIGERGTNAITLESISSLKGEDASSSLIALENGTHAEGQWRALNDITLKRVDHIFGEHRSTNQETLAAVFHRSGSHSINAHETLSSIRHIHGQHDVTQAETLKSGAHVVRQFKASNRLTLVSLSHKSGTDKGLIASTVKNGIMSKGDIGRARLSDTFIGGEYAFGLLTFDNTDSDHFDSTKFTWDLNVSPDDEEIPP